MSSADWSDDALHESKFLTANGVRLNYLDWGGSDSTLILIHGIGDNPHAFDDLAPAFTDSFRVVAYARRSHGLSEVKAPYDSSTLAEDLRGLMDGLGVERAHLAGWSMGGNELTALAGTHPERVKRLVYLEGAYDWADPMAVESLRAYPGDVTPPPEALTSFDAFRSYQMGFAAAGMDPRRLEAYLREMVVVQPDGTVRNRTSDSVAEAIQHALETERRDYTKVRSPALAIYSEAFQKFDYDDLVKREKIQAWEREYATPFRARSMERVRRELPRVEILTVPGTHGNFLFASRNPVVAAMRRFLDEPSPPA